VIAPGLIATEGVMTTSDISALESQVVPLQKVKRVGQPSDIAEAIAFLVSPESGFTTGQTLFVDGGMVFH
jgi:3-oxoacyl-[acyl-carrier protein] reductase